MSDALRLQHEYPLEATLLVLANNVMDTLHRFQLPMQTPILSGHKPVVMVRLGREGLFYRIHQLRLPRRNKKAGAVARIHQHLREQRTWVFECITTPNSAGSALIYGVCRLDPLLVAQCAIAVAGSKNTPQMAYRSYDDDELPLVKPFASMLPKDEDTHAEPV